MIDAKISGARVGWLRPVSVLSSLVSLSVLSAACSGGDPTAPSRTGTQAPVPRETSSARETVAKSTAALAGVDGVVSITAPNTTVNRYTALAANAAANATSVTVASVAALSIGADALGPGDLVLIVQMQGATLEASAANSSWGSVTSLGGAGLYEFVEVTAVNAATNQISLACGLRNAYALAGAVQVIRVPQYQSLTINSGASVVAPAWDGVTGGVVAVHAQNTVTLTGEIDVSARGFRGGPADNASGASGTEVALFASDSAADGARKGEGIGGLLAQFGRAPAANGGGGGNSHNGGGGGGANGRFGAVWKGQGVFDLTLKGGSAWLLDPNYSALSSEGGGRGGYTFSNEDLNALTVAPGKAGWGGNLRRELGGLGGHPVDNDPATRLFLGGGGGAGDGNNTHAGRGGNGGGLVIVMATSVTGAGRILANGEAGVDANSELGGPVNGDAPGGGGGGGTVVVRATTISGFTVQARGGAGGSQILENGDEAEGPGGGGGGGYVALAGAVVADVAGGIGGTTDAAAVSEFPSNGATAGGSGQTSFLPTTVANVPYCVDSSVPNTTISTNPTSPTSDTTGAFTFTSNESPVTFECRLDGAAYAACNAAYTTPALAQGSHTLEVRARDLVGNVDPTPASYTWVVDTAAPTTTIATAPANPTNDTTGAFAFTSNESPVTFECSLDGAAFAACSAAYTTAALSPGSHTLSVRARDAAGNVDATPVSHTWVIDTTTPDTTIATRPANPTADATAAFTFTSNEASVTFECNLDGGGFNPCSASYTTAALAPGAHTLAVRARDQAGNVDATPATYGWVFDNGAPDTAIATGPAATTSDSTGDFTFTATETPATFQCSLDGAAYVACTASWTTPVLADGQHTLRVRARDASLNTDATPAAHTWTIDTTPPNTMLVTAPAAETADRTGDFTFASSQPGSTFQCRLDAAAWAACTTPHVTAPLGAGSHTLEVRAIDPAGNVDPSPVTHTWQVLDSTDTDGDGVPDGEEEAIGTDPEDADSDDDGVLDGDEPSYDDDTDEDGLINALDPDSDNDGLFDGTEVGNACDNAATSTSRRLCVPDADAGETVTDPLDADSDDGGVSDGSEDTNLDGAVGAGETDPTAGNGADDASVTDSDDDGLSDGTERTLGSDPNDADSDDDGAPDGDEPNPSADGDGDGLVGVRDVDSDDDGILDGTELGLGCSLPATNAALGHCRADADPTTTTSAVDPDTDDGGARDGSEDSNLDGAVDAGETDPTAGQEDDDADVTDSDGDGLSDGTEETLGSDPADDDTDDDGLLDGDEANPSDDQDGDELIGILDPDSDGDGLFDGTEAGKNCDDAATNIANDRCIADADDATTTFVLVPDTDGGSIADGDEDTNRDGALDPGERDPLDPADDDPSSGEGGASGQAGQSGEAGQPGQGGEGGSGDAGAAGAGATGGAAAAGSGGVSGAGVGGGVSGGGGRGGGGRGGVTGGIGGGTEPPDEDVVVLGGGVCGFRPASEEAGFASLLAAMLAAAAWRRRRRG